MEIPEIILVPQQSIKEYVKRWTKHYQSGTASEMTYYDDFKRFLESIFPLDKGYLIQIAPKIAGSRDKPDFVVSFNGITLFYIEAKAPFTPVETMVEFDPSARINDQISRYQADGAQLLLTDFVNVWLMRPKGPTGDHPEKTPSVHTQKTSHWASPFQFSCTLIEQDHKSRMVPAKNAQNQLQELLTLTCAAHLNSISNAKKLIYPLADIAKNIRVKTQFLLESIAQPSTLSTDQVLAAKFLADIQDDFAKSLFKEETAPKVELFADLFAQTIVYGSFSAWIKFCQKQRGKAKSFSLNVVGDYLPFGSFLRAIFLDLKNKTPREFQPLFQEMEGRFQKTEFSPVINNSETLITTFYSDFLALYDPQTAKERGVVYTPHEIVEFMVKGVDFLLQRWFDKPDGVVSSTVRKKIPDSDTLQERILKATQQQLFAQKGEIPIDRLRILDPAAGTMAFASGLLHVAKQKFHDKYPGQPGLAASAFEAWVKKEFFENMYAFEILMAPYVLGHIRTFLTLQDLGVSLNAEQFQLKSYLMNTLMSPPDQTTLDDWIFHNEDIGREVKEALRIRDQKEIFVVLGNPPYNLSSQNDCDWINRKINDYKEGLYERNKKILSDDYVKFIRFAQWKIQKVGKGIVAFITNSRYLDGQMFSVMRKSLRETFDHIYIVNLHGDYRKKEAGNPFDIKVGVSIALMVRVDNSPDKHGAVHYMDVPEPAKEAKFLRLAQGFSEAQFKLLPPTPRNFFIDIDTTYLERYLSFLPMDKLFKARPISGIMAGKDQLVVDTDEGNLHQNMDAFFSDDLSPLDHWKIRYNDTKSWKRADVLRKTNKERAIGSIQTMLYRGWDYRYIVYDRAILEGHRMGYIDQITHANPAITVSKSSRKPHFCTAFISGQLIEKCYMSVTDTSYAFLFKYNGKSNILSPKVGYPTPDTKLFHYIYAILHCPAYRGRYDELLRKGFPRIPFPKGGRLFLDLASVGEGLAAAHLLQLDINPKLETADVAPDAWKVREYWYDAGNECLYFDKPNAKAGNAPWIKGISPEDWAFTIGNIPQIRQFLASRTFSAQRKKNTLQRPLTFDELLYLLKMVTAIQQTRHLYPRLDALYLQMDPDE